MTIHVPTADAPSGAFEAAVVRPAGGATVPAIVIIPSMFGITNDLRATMETWAARGFIVVAVDSFWRTHAGPLPENPEGFAQAIARVGSYDLDGGLADLRGVRDALATFPEWNGRWATVGYCFGGRTAMLGMTRLGADAAITFHGTGMLLELVESAANAKAFSLHFGDDDEVVPLAEVEAIRAALAGKAGDIHTYAGAKHGFALRGARHFDPVAGPQAEDRAFALLERLR